MKIKPNRNSEAGFSAGGSTATATKNPTIPTNDQAAKNLLTQGSSRPKVGFSSTIIGDNKPANTETKKSLLGE